MIVAAVSAGALLLAGLGTAIAVGRQHGRSGVEDEGPAVAATPGPSVAAFELPTADKDALVKGLSSADPATESAVLASGLRASFQSSGLRVLPAGSAVTIAAGGATVSGGTARVTAVVTGPQPGNFLLLLMREGEHWLLYGTKQVH